MLPGPIFRRELKAVTRRRGSFVTRTIVGLLVAAPILLAGFGWLGWAAFEKDVYTPQELRTFGGLLLIAVMFVETVSVMTLALTMVGPAVAESARKTHFRFSCSRT